MTDCLVGRVVAIETCQTRNFGFDSRVGRSITGLFSVFRKFLSSSTESGNVPAALRTVMCSSAYPFGDKRREVAYSNTNEIYHHSVVGNRTRDLLYDSRTCNHSAEAVIVLGGFRETSFLYALTAAGVAHSIARACAQGRLISCGCDPLGYRASHDPRGRAKVNKWEWSGCSHNLAYGIEFSKKFLDVREQVDDLQSKINVHNNNAGRSFFKKRRILRKGEVIVSGGLSAQLFFVGIFYPCVFACKLLRCDVAFMRSSVDLFVDRLYATSVISHLSCVATNHILSTTL
ncbi:hypothetical protein SFRURICE_021317 [Spodoptera frugiperda]|nr:hypothetical protein SFRURICE_021317 [Spodoptera frugiperda]